MGAGPAPGELTHIPTPFSGYNRVFGGIELGITTTVLGHTGEGKSSLLRALTVHSAKQVIPSLWVSGEDPDLKTQDRVLSGETGIPTVRLNRKDVDAHEKRQLLAAVDQFPACLELHSKTMGSTELIAYVRTWVKLRRKETKGPILVCIDYLQAFVETREPEQELANLVRELNGLAGEEQIAIVAASQVRSESVNEAKRRFANSKPPPQCPNNWRDFAAFFRPQKGDAEYCRRIEKASKAVWVWFRPARWARDIGNWNVPDDEVEIHVIKANFGPEGSSTLRWDGATQRVYE